MTRDLKQVADARKRRDTSTSEFHRLICEAAEKHTLREVADAAGLSPARVWQIVSRTRTEAT